MDFRDKVVIITGASTGIGRELGLQLGQKGAHVVLAARRKDRIEANAEQIRSLGGKALAIPTDVSRRSAVEDLVRETVRHFGGVDVLINNAGVSLARGTFMENSEKDIQDTMNTNFWGCLYGVWAVVPEMERRGGGQVVFISSCVGKRAVPLSSIYCSSKFAIQGWAESIRVELKRKKVHVLTVCPPGVDTDFFKNTPGNVVRRFRLHSTQKICRMIVRACEKERREVLLTMDSKLLHWLNLVAPALLDKALAKAKGV